MTTPLARRPIELRKYVRNGRIPDARFAQLLAEDANALAKYRLKELARVTAPIEAIPGKGGPSRVRWRFACHTSPYARAILVRAAMAPCEAASGYAPRTEVTFVDAAATAYGTASLPAPIVVGPPVDVPSNFGDASAFVLSSPGHPQVIPGDTTLYGTVTDIEDGRIAAITVYEVALDVPLPIEEGFAAGTPIEDEGRGSVTELLRAAWLQQAAPLLTWTVDDASAPRSSISTSFRNIIDDTSTAVSAATPGITPDLEHASTLRRVTVPCVMYVYASATVSTATVALRDATGAFLIGVSIPAGAAGWRSAVVELPATAAKYDLHFAAGAAGTVTLYAVSLFPYDDA